MLPGSTWLSVLFFFLFVAPGTTFDLQSRRRRATYEESALLEASRIILASLVFTGFALVVLLLVREARPSWTPEPRRLIAQDGMAYFRDNYPLVLGSVAVGAGLACAAAWGANLLLAKRQGGATISPISAWTQTVRRDCPAGHDTYARVRLDDGSVYWGLVANFSSNLDVEGRELVLAQPLQSRVGDADLAPVPKRYQRVILRGDTIRVLSIEYRRSATRATTAENNSGSAARSRAL